MTKQFLSDKDLAEMKSHYGHFPPYERLASHIAALEELVEKQESSLISARNFIRIITLWLQRHASHTESEKAAMFQTAYELYCLHNVEGKKESAYAEYQKARKG